MGKNGTVKNGTAKNGIVKNGMVKNNKETRKIIKKSKTKAERQFRQNKYK
jgi:cell division ATPase FtsA